MPAASVALAIAAALLFALSAAWQQSAARSNALANSHRLRLLVLVRDRLWLAGFLANLAGFAAHAFALRLGSIAIVQALLVLQLLFALPIGAARRHRRPLHLDWIGTGLVCVGLALVVVQYVPRGPVVSDRLPLAAAVAVAAIAVLLGAAQLTPRPQVKTGLTAVAAGFCFTTTAVLLTLATAELPHVGWPALLIVGSTLTGGWLVQKAFASGSLPTALTAMTITDPILSYVAGLTLFDVDVNPQFVPLAATAVLVISGVVLLANSPTIYDEREAVDTQPARTLVS